MGRYKVLVAAIAVLFIACGRSSAFPDDGFGPARKAKGVHFTIFYSPQVDESSLARQLNVRAADELLVGKSPGGGGLADMVDTLFMQACDILDMQLYSYEGNIKVCASEALMDQIYSNLFDKTLRNKKSFYVNDLNTIYISADSFRREILGHEIAHAIISHYFVVLPSVKIQEVLATYVEYQLRKSGQQR